MPATLATETIALSGEIDLHRSQEVKETLAEPILRKTTRILVDLSAVSYIDSSGLAVLIEALQSALAYGGRLCLFGLQETVRNIFGIARLDQVFEIYPDKAAALAEN